MMCVGNDDDVREVTLGANGAYAGMKKGALFVDHTSASAEVARELHAEAKKFGLEFVDAPVSGGQSGAKNGVLTVMCGGDAKPYARAEEVITAYARMYKLIGAPGAGQLAKMVNQIRITGLVQGLADGIHFAKKAGLDVEAVIQTISKGAAQRRTSARHRARRPVLRRGADDGRRRFATRVNARELSGCHALRFGARYSEVDSDTLHGPCRYPGNQHGVSYRVRP